MTCGKIGCQMSTAGTCGDPFCPMKGGFLPGIAPPYQVQPAPTFYPTPMGCICPPTSEQTCKNPACPRGGGQPLPIT